MWAIVILNEEKDVFLFIYLLQNIVLFQIILYNMCVLYIK